MGKSNIDKLMELKQLYEQGILTKEEMEAEKAKILNTVALKEESINRNVSPNDAIESSTSSPSVNNRYNNKVIFGIATFIVVAIVAVICYYLNKQSESPKLATDDIELSQLAGADDMNEAKTDTEGTDSPTSIIINTNNKVEGLLKN